MEKEDPGQAGWEHIETNIKKAENKEIFTEKVCIHKMPQIRFISLKG